MKRLWFKSIEAVHLHGLTHFHLGDVNSFLKLSTIVEKELFFVIKVSADATQSNSQFSSLFSTLCKNIYNLVVMQIPLDIKIGIRSHDVAV